MSLSPLISKFTFPGHFSSVSRDTGVLLGEEEDADPVALSPASSWGEWRSAGRPGALISSEFQGRHLRDFSVGFATTLVGSFPEDSSVGTFLVMPQWVASHSWADWRAGFLLHLRELLCHAVGTSYSILMKSEPQHWVKGGPSSKYVSSLGILTQVLEAVTSLHMCYSWIY